MKALTKSERLSVFNMFGGRCAYCGCVLPTRWHADHLKPIERKSAGEAWKPENHTIANMMPSCPTCNISKATLDLDGWRKWLEGHVRSLGAYNTPYKLARTYGLIQETGKAVTFYFESVAHGIGISSQADKEAR